MRQAYDYWQDQPDCSHTPDLLGFISCGFLSFPYSQALRKRTGFTHAATTCLGSCGPHALLSNKRFYVRTTHGLGLSHNHSRDGQCWTAQRTRQASRHNNGNSIHLQVTDGRSYPASLGIRASSSLQQGFLRTNPATLHWARNTGKATGAPPNTSVSQHQINQACPTTRESISMD